MKILRAKGVQMQLRRIVVNASDIGYLTQAVEDSKDYFFNKLHKLMLPGLCKRHAELLAFLQGIQEESGTEAVIELHINIDALCVLLHSLLRKRQYFIHHYNHDEYRMWNRIYNELLNQVDKVLWNRQKYL